VVAASLKEVLGQKLDLGEEDKAAPRGTELARKTTIIRGPLFTSKVDSQSKLGGNHAGPVAHAQFQTLQNATRMKGWERSARKRQPLP
jgi:hypothetical protein